MSDITNKERLLKVFSGEETDRIPLTLYTGLFPRGFVERELRNDGVGLFCIPSPALTMKNPKVNKKILEIYENEVFFIKNIFSTPIGEVSETYRTGGGYNTKLLCEFLIKDKKDYEVAEFVLENEKYEFDFELNKEREENIGEDGIVVPMLPKTPLQDMMYNLMGPERFSIELHENSKDFLHLYDVLFQRYKKMCEILSDASVGFVEIGDNITSDMIGKDRFRKYIMPVYEFV